MATEVNIDTTELREFFDEMGRAGSELETEMKLWLEAVGTEFLDTVQDEIKRRKVMDSRLLLASFQKGDMNNIWKLSDGDLTLEVGSATKYAYWVEYGHTQQPGRFIPGYWRERHDEDRGTFYTFVYDPGADTGMVLKANWVEGKHYFESALKIMNDMFPDLMEKKMQQWLDKYFGG